MPRGTPFLYAKKAGPNADSTATTLPGPRKCLRICPGLIKREKKRQGESP